jgi:exopolysaccharide biosynthesis polyprenyl glycosylphosphotransferase
MEHPASGSLTLVDTCNRKVYRLLAAAIDLASLIIAWEFALQLRVLLNPMMHNQMTLSQVERLTPPVGWIVLIWVSALMLISQRPISDYSIGTHLLRIVHIWLFASALVVASTFAERQMGTDMSRSFAILYPLSTFIALLVGRYIALLTAPRLERRYITPEQVGFVGDGPEILALIEHIGYRGDSIVRVAGVVRPAAARSGEMPNYPVPVLGTTNELASVINRERISRLIISDNGLAQDELQSCTRLAGQMGVTVSRSVLQLDCGQFQFRHLCGLQLLELKPVHFTRKQEMVKRGCDLAVALITLVMLLPLMMVVALLIKLTSTGPVLYKAPRVGKGGRHFTFLKFRSMRVSDGRQDIVRNRSGHIFKVKHDPRVTALGRILRRYSLDELPQLVNVVKGEMSLVGPRPLPAEDLDADGQSSRFRSWSNGRSGVLPGITGLWQVSGRSDTGFEQMMQLDLEYIRQWSLTLDFKILLETPLAVISSRGAY